jgi:hypothetical protein
MTADDYRRALDKAIGEYETLGAERRAIDKRLTELTHTISTLSRLCGLTPTVPWGLTDACRVVLRGGGPMTATDVRDHLLSIGFDLSKYSNDLAAIHTVLKRLKEAGETRLLAGAPNRGAYFWDHVVAATKMRPEIAEMTPTPTSPASSTRRAKTRARSKR